MSYEFEFYDEETEAEYECEAEVSNTFERNYGADADGRRGVPMDFPELDSLTVYLDGKEVTDPGVLKRAQDYFNNEHWDRAAEQAIEAHHEPDEEDYDVCFEAPESET